MNLLAFDTSTEVMSVALGRGGELWHCHGPGGAQASAALIPAIQSLLAQAGMTLRQLDAIAFGCGPGSFTGLRTACSVAQGLALGAGLPVLPVNTLLAVAEDARERHGAVRVVPALDARMEEIYSARFEWTHGLWQQHGGYSLGPPASLDVPSGWALAGNVFAVYGANLPPAAQTFEATPHARALLRLAPALLSGGHAVPPEEALPFYIRDKVAQTTEERAVARAALANSS